MLKGEWSAWHPLKGDVKVEFSGIYLTLSRNVYPTHSEYLIVTIIAGC